MFESNVWKAIDDAGLARARLINDGYKSWDKAWDRKCQDLHNNYAIEIKQNYPEMNDYSITTIKELIEEHCSEYVVPEAKVCLRM